MNRYQQQDEQLYQAVYSLMCGNTNSYYDMYNLSIKYIYKIIYDIVQDYHTTEDLVQETYLTIYNNLVTLQDINKFYTWAGRIATNLTLRYIQSNRRELLLLDSEEGAEGFVFDVASQDMEAFIPESILMDMEKQRIIGDIIDELSVEQKLVVQYFYYEEMSVSEIATIMGCPVGTVKSRLNYARKAIKEAVVNLDINENTRLYSLATVPLFLLVFRETVERFFLAEGVTSTVAAGTSSSAGAGTVGGNTVATGTSSSAGAGTVGGNAVAGKTVTGTMGKVFGTMAGKIATGVMAGAVILGGGIAIHNAVTEDVDDLGEDYSITTEVAENVIDEVDMVANSIDLEYGDAVTLKYHQIITELCEYGMWPDGTYIETEADLDLSEHEYGILDIDGDGRKELVINIDKMGIPDYGFRIYDYDPETDTLVLQAAIASIDAEFYENGTVVAPVYPNPSCPPFQAYELYVYDGATDSYKAIAFVATRNTSDCDPAVGLAEVDVDGDGFVYDVGFYESEYRWKYMDNSEYDTWIAQYIEEGAEPITVLAEPMSNVLY